MTTRAKITAGLGLLFFCAALQAAAAAAQPPVRSPFIADCPASGVKDLCRAPVRFDAAEADRRLGRVNLTYWLDGPVLNIAARVAGPQSQLAGTIQDGMIRLAGGADVLWGAAYRAANLDKAIIELSIRGQPTDAPVFTYRGARAPAAPPANAVLKGRLEVIQAPSAALGAARKISVYLPPGETPKGGFPAIIATDGGAIAPYVAIVDALIERRLIAPVAVIAVWTGDDAATSAGKTPQAREYIRGVDPDAYARHNMFVQRELMPLIQKRFPISAAPGDRMLFGYAEGADWVLETAVRAPQLAHHVAAFSVPGASEPPFQPGKGLDLQLASGFYEPPYLRATRYTFNLAGASGVPSKLDVIYSGYSAQAWQYEFAKAVTETFSHLRQSR